LIALIEDGFSIMTVMNVIKGFIQVVKIKVKYTHLLEDMYNYGLVCLYITD